MKEQNFKFRKEYLDIVNSLSKEEQVEFYNAIMNYGIYNKDHMFTNNIKNSIFSLIKLVINRDREPIIDINNHPSERENSAKEKEFPSFSDMQSLDVEEPIKQVTLTEDLIRAGMTGGVGINKKQREILHTDLAKGWINNLIGTCISQGDYEKFLSLKGAIN